MGDFSNQYTEDKKGFIQFTFGNKTINFKPFLDSISFTMDRKEVETTKHIYTRVGRTGPFKSSRYSLSFSVPSTNLKESINNHGKFQKLARMVCPNESNINTNRAVGLRLSNLINSVGSNSFIGIIQKVNYKPIMELGFFEDNGFVFAKAFAISIEIMNLPSDKITPPYRRTSYYYGDTTLTQAENILEDETPQSSSQLSGSENIPSGQGGGGSANAPVSVGTDTEQEDQDK